MIVTTRIAESADCRGDCYTGTRPAILSNLTVATVVAEVSRPSQFHSNFDGCGSGRNWFNFVIGRSKIDEVSI
jgi:hypothetical protein